MTANNNARPVVVSYTPKILRNMTEICAEMGVGQETVRRWAESGAPIAVESDGKKTRYSVETAVLQAWRTENC